jgi:NAD(P)H dehydrogenase (quinone)
MILVTGAGGKTGRAVVAALVAQSAAVRALVHREEQTGPATALGAREVCVGSFDDAAALARAVAGASAIYHICPNVSPYEVAYAGAVIEAASAAGVRRLVYHSVLHPQVEAMPHHWNKMRVEEMLFASALDVTVLQPAAYIQNILAGWREIAEAGIYRVPYPVESRLSLVDLDDVAEAAALVLTQQGHGGATYELVGAAPLSQLEVAQALSEALDRPVRAVAEPIEDWEARARAAGMGEHQIETLLKMFRYYARHGLVGNPRVLTWLLGRAPTTLAEFARRAATSPLPEGEVDGERLRDGG